MFVVIWYFEYQVFDLTMICKDCGLERIEKRYLTSTIPVTGKKYYKIICKSCKSLREKKYNEANKEMIKRKSRKYYWENPDKACDQRLKRVFGITLDEYNILLEKQGYKCKICERPTSDFKKRLHVDHCHKTGKIRGLLCYTCNSGLGYLKDSIYLLFKAIFYLKSSRAS